MKRSLSRTLLAAAVLGLASPALAQQVLTVNASVSRSCLVGTPTATIALAAWNPIAGAPTDGTTTYTMRCTKGTTISVAASLGSGGAVGAYPRSVTGPTAADKIGYRLYAGNGTASTELTTAAAQSSGVSGLGKNLDTTVTMTASLDPTADPAAGDYTDQVLLTFTAN